MFDLVPVWAWSYILACFGLAGLWLAGSGKRVGWLLGIVAQVFWLAYALATDQWGFVLTCFGYGGVYVRNWLKWRREERRLQAEAKRLADLQSRVIDYGPTLDLLRGRTAV